MNKPDVGGAVRKAVPAVLFANDVSPAGLHFIAREEGCPLNSDGTLRVYDDAKGYATVGIGRLLHYSHYTGTDVAMYRGKRFPDAIVMLHHDVERYVRAVNSIGLKLRRQEFDALTSFTYNVGPGAPGQGGLLGSSLVAYLKSGGRNPGEITALFHHYDDGGLLRGRRGREAALYTNGTY